MRKGFSLLSTIFGFFVFIVVIFIVFVLGREMISKGIIDLDLEKTNNVKQLDIDVAKKAAQNYHIYKENGWHKIELINNEWDSKDSFLEIIYFSYDKEITTFYSIVHPKSYITFLEPSKTNSSMIIGFGEKKEKLSYTNFKPGDRIISGFGIIHELSKDKDDLIVNPPISEIEIERNFILIEDINAIIEKFIIAN